MTLPAVSVLSLGGTIAMTDVAGSGVVPTLTGQMLVSAMPELAAVADISAVSFRQLPGAHLTIDDIIALSLEVRRHIDAGARGVVITQGTDTIEETAFALDLLVSHEAPVVVTGAMRNPTLPGADGPANLLAAVQVAASERTRGLGTLVVFHDEIHAARYVQKLHTASPAAFRSSLAGPIGWIAETTPRIAWQPVNRHHIALPAHTRDRPVALLTTTLGDDGRLLSAVRDSGYRGLVIEALGGGHVPALMLDPLTRLAAQIPVILTSRTGGGEVLRQTYGFPGSETDLLRRGLIGAGPLDGPKARILLTLLLRSGARREDISRAFQR